MGWNKLDSIFTYDWRVEAENRNWESDKIFQRFYSHMCTFGFKMSGNVPFKRSYKCFMMKNILKKFILEHWIFLKLNKTYKINQFRNALFLK